MTTTTIDVNYCALRIERRRLMAALATWKKEKHRTECAVHELTTALKRWRRRLAVVFYGMAEGDADYWDFSSWEEAVHECRQDVYAFGRKDELTMKEWFQRWNRLHPEQV